MSDNAPGWYADPSGQHKLRYWDGAQWTDQVNDFEVTTTDPISSELAQVPPAPGTAPTAPQPQPTGEPGGGESRTNVLAIVIGALVVVALVIAILIALDDDDDTAEEGPSTTVVVVTPTTGGETTTTTATSVPPPSTSTTASE